jgi:hypothetical protein
MRVAHAGGIRERHRHARDLEALAHAVARGPRLLGDDRALLAEQRVEE